MAEADSIGTGDLQGQWPQFHTGVDLLGWTGNCFILGNNHQVMKAHGKFSVISGTVSLADLWSFLILSEIQDRYMMQISQRCVLILWCCSYLVNVLFPCCPIFFSLTTACAKSGYLVDLLNYLSFYKHPVNYTRGINVYIYIQYIDIVPRPRPTVHFLGIFRYLQCFSGILPTPSPDFLVHHAKIPGRKPPTSIHAWLSISP